MINPLHVATNGHLQNRTPLTLATVGFISAAILDLFVAGNEFVWSLNEQNETWTLLKRNYVWAVPLSNETWSLKTEKHTWTIVAKRVNWTLFNEGE